MQLTILIIEDDPIDLISIKAKIRELGYDEPVTSDHKTDLNHLIEKTNPQLVISDIYYDQKPLGLSLIDICKAHNNIPLILITADTRFDTYNQAHKHEQVAYLVKPFHHFTLKTCIDMVMEHSKAIAPAEDRFMFVKGYGNEKVKLNYKNILFIRAEGNFCHIQCQKEQYMIRTSLTKLDDELCKDFIRVHKRFIINKMHVKKIASDHLTIELNEIPIGRKYKGSIPEVLLG